MKNYSYKSIYNYNCKDRNDLYIFINSFYKYLKKMKKNLEKVNYKNFTDNRGSFNKFFGTKELSIKNFRIKEINFVNNLKKYTFRGFHYQREPFNETKLVTVLSGSIIDFGLNLDKKVNILEKFFKDEFHQNLNFLLKYQIIMPMAILH